MMSNIEKKKNDSPPQLLYDANQAFIDGTKSEPYHHLDIKKAFAARHHIGFDDPREPKSKVKTGFGFLGASAGYDVLMSLIPFGPTDTYFRVFIVGFLNTILVSVLSIVFATIIGFIVGVMYFSENWLVKRISIFYVEIFRNIPLLFQIFLWYFAVLAALPNVRNSLSLGEAIFLNIRGL